MRGIRKVEPNLMSRQILPLSFMTKGGTSMVGGISETIDDKATFSIVHF